MTTSRLPSGGEYGSDRNGLVWGFLFDPGAGPREVDSDEAAAALGAPIPEGTFYWLHFSQANAGAERWLRQNARLPDAFFEALHAPGGGTRVELDEEALIAVIHDVLFDFQHEVSDVSSLTLSVRPGVMISARLKPLRSVERLREKVKAGGVCRSPVELLALLLQNQADVLTEIVRKSSDQVDTIEDSVLTRQIGTNRASLSSLRRTLVRLQRLLAPEPAALFRLLNRPPPWIHDDDVQDLRRSAEEFSAAVSDCAALVERAKLIQEELAAMVNEQTNRSLFLLTFVTVLLLPFNVVGGLFGMNVGGIPLAQDPTGFWIIVVVVTALTALAANILIRNLRR